VIQEMSARKAEEWEIDAAVRDMLKQAFRPEFLNRVDESIVFHPLGKPQLAKIVDIQLRNLRKRLEARNMKFVITDAAERLLAEEGYDPTFGARPLKRVIQQRIENPLAQKLLAGEFGEGDTIRIDADQSNQQFVINKGREVHEGELVS
jgi:ATP-dependent Clp protease ATP-binding subunit ClpB